LPPAATTPWPLTARAMCGPGAGTATAKSATTPILTATYPSR